MKTVNTFGVHFIVRTNKVRDGKAPLYARISVNKKRCEIALKQWIRLCDWNGPRGMAKPKNVALKQVNNYLKQARGQIAEHFQELQLQKN